MPWVPAKGGAEAGNDGNKNARKRGRFHDALTQYAYCTASFGDGCGPDLAQNFHQAASPFAFGFRKRLSG